MRKRLPLLFILAFLIAGSSMAADTGNTTDLGRELPGIGRAHYYRTGANTYMGINLNLEMLYICTAAGSGFKHPAYCFVRNDISTAAKKCFLPFRYDEDAQWMDGLSLQMDEFGIPQRRFHSGIVDDVLSYDQILAETQIHKASPAKGLQPGELRGRLRRFYGQANAEAFFVRHLEDYNKMTEGFVAKYQIDHVARLEEFFGLDMSMNRFEVILSPMYYGAEALETANADGTTTYISIINPLYHVTYYWCFDALYHETAHNFIDEILQGHVELVRRHEKCLRTAMGRAKGVVKGNGFSFLNEMLARVATLAMLEKYHGREMAARDLFLERICGWKDLDEIYDLIKREYLPQRAKYPAFGDFLPVILDFFGDKYGGVQPEIPENTEARIVTVYWPGEQPSWARSPQRPHSFLIEVEFDLPKPDIEHISAFLRQAGTKFNLVAADKPPVTAEVYLITGNTVKGRYFRGLWLFITEEGYALLQKGQPYGLVPSKYNPAYRWVVAEGLRIVPR